MPSFETLTLVVLFPFIDASGLPFPFVNGSVISVETEESVANSPKAERFATGADSSAFPVIDDWVTGLESELMVELRSPSPTIVSSFFCVTSPKVRSTVVVVLAVTFTIFCTGSKFGASALTPYCPRGSAATVHRPDSLAVTDLFAPVLRLVTVIDAFGINSLLGSVTVPASEPLSDCWATTAVDGGKHPSTHMKKSRAILRLTGFIRFSARSRYRISQFSNRELGSFSDLVTNNPSVQLLRRGQRLFNDLS